MLLVHLIICFSYVQHLLELISFLHHKNSYKLCKLVKRFTRITYVNLLGLRCKVTNLGQIFFLTWTMLDISYTGRPYVEIFNTTGFHTFYVKMKIQLPKKIITLNHLMWQKASSINQLRSNTIKIDKCDKWMIL